MKHLKIAFFLAFLGLASTGFGQFSFTIVGEADPLNGPDGPYVISAYGTIDFDTTLNTVDVTLTNTGTSTSQITAFYLLRPTEPLTAILDSSEIMTTPPGTTADADPAWVVSNDMSGPANAGLDKFLYGPGSADWDGSRYFGAKAGERLDYLADDITPISDKGMFSFSFDGGFTDADVTAWHQQLETPQFFVRWQGVGDDFADSGKGYIFSDDPNFDPSVPEPSQVALMAVAGLGGLLLIRRRIQSRRRKA